MRCSRSCGGWWMACGSATPSWSLSALKWTDVYHTKLTDVNLACRLEKSRPMRLSRRTSRHRCLTVWGLGCKLKLLGFSRQSRDAVSRLGVEGVVLRVWSSPRKQVSNMVYIFTSNYPAPQPETLHPKTQTPHSKTPKPYPGSRGHVLTSNFPNPYTPIPNPQPPNPKQKTK